MLNKIVKLIGLGVIIGLNGLSACGNRIDVFYEGEPTLVAEGIDGVELPAELSDPNHDLWYEYDPYVRFIGIRLNLPEGLVQDCESEYWKIYDEILIQELEEIVASEENFHAWCDKQKEIRYPNHNTGCIHAYILKKANEKNYLIPKGFCKHVGLSNILYSIRKKNYLCCSCVDPNSPKEKYLIWLSMTIKDYFFN